MSFGTSGVNELWPEIYNLVISAMDLTPEHNSGKLALSSGLCAGRRPSGFGCCILPFLCSPLTVAQEACCFTQAPLLLAGERHLHLNPVTTVIAQDR